MLIFNEFPNREAAEAFGKFMRDTYGKRTIVCDSHDESDTYDPFPYVLTPPIVLVDRTKDDDVERQMREQADQFNGVYAGT